jgi:L-lactate dehydrogenase complex protein LldG
MHENAIAARLAFLLFLQEKHIDQITAWSPAELPLAGLSEALDDAGIQVISPDRRDIDPDAVVGLTSAHAALAATGSLVLVPEPGQSWLPALLPIRHLILLPTSRLHTDLHSWRRAWEQEDRHEDLARALVITGPSYSSDIELHAHRGMFGPRLLHVLLISDD